MTIPSSTFSSKPIAPLAGEMPGMAALHPAARPAEIVGPNALVRWAFYLSVFAIPFALLYLPGTGGRLGVTRLVQILIVAGIFSQPRVCLRFVPTALFWFLGYVAIRVLLGLWLTPDQFPFWWPTSREFLELLIPWLWVMFNVLQFPAARRGGLWALALSCSFCALSHLTGIGVSEVSDGFEVRSSVFGLNANGLATDYAIAMIALLGLWMLRPRTLSQRLLPFPLIILNGIGMAKTGSRTGILVLGVGVLVLLIWGRALCSKTERVAALLAVGAVVGVAVWQIPTVMERFQEINTRDLGHGNPRARMAPVLWEMYQRSPLYGLGPDSYENELTRRAMPYLIKERRLIVSHNLVLLLLVETGILGFLLFAFGLGTPLVAAWKARLSPCGPLPLALLLPLVIAGATVSDPSHHMVLWVAMAYSLAGTA